MNFKIKMSGASSSAFLRTCFHTLRTGRNGQLFLFMISIIFSISTEAFPGEVPVEGVVDVNTALHFRETPNGRILDSLKGGTKLEIIGEEGNWWKVKYGGRTGYCYKQYVDITKTEKRENPSDNNPPRIKKREPRKPSSLSEHAPFEYLESMEKFSIKKPTGSGAR